MVPEFEFGFKNIKRSILQLYNKVLIKSKYFKKSIFDCHIYSTLLVFSLQ
jgi:hypothetical protein